MFQGSVGDVLELVMGDEDNISEGIIIRFLRFCTRIFSEWPDVDELLDDLMVPLEEYTTEESELYVVQRWLVGAVRSIREVCMRSMVLAILVGF